jgi:sedoheptulokinase
MADAGHEPLLLGIDCGTSKVAVAVLTTAGRQVLTAAAAHGAELAVAPGRAEQDPARILTCAEGLVRALPAPLRAAIAAVGLTGQMHGVLLHDASGAALTPLVTWQDRRVLEDPAFLAACGLPLHAGYGLATLAWWARHGGLPPGARAATIHGFLAARWCGLERAPIDPTDAQAWGGAVPPAGVPAGALPTAVGHGERVGALSAGAAAALGLAMGLPVAAPLGDNQASLRATLDDPARALAFTLGTGCQLTAVLPRAAAFALGRAERRPFSAQADLLVAAPLCGGAAWQWLADTAASWCADLGLAPPPRAELFALLDRLGSAAADRLEFAPHLAGERHDPALTATLRGLALANGRLGEVARAVARGLAANARDLLPAAARDGRTHVVASGNALRRSALLRAMAEAEFGVPLVLSACVEEAASGAALVAGGVVVSA